MPTKPPQITNRVQFPGNPGSVPVTIKNTQSRYATLSNKTGIMDMYELGANENMAATSPGLVRQCEKKSTWSCPRDGKQRITPDAHAAPFEPRLCTYGESSVPTVSCNSPSIGQDLWRQLKRVQIPVFSGDKRTYQSWKTAFLACTDSAPATGDIFFFKLNFVSQNVRCMDSMERYFSQIKQST